MKKKIWLIIGIIVAIAALVFAVMPRHAPVAQGDKPIIRIGAVLPLTGDYNENGEIAKEALLMFQRDLKDKNTRNRYEFIIEGQDHWDLKSGSTISSKFVSHDKVSAIISYWDAAGQVVSQNVKNAPVVHFNMGASMDTISHSNSFNMGPRLSSEAAASLVEMKRLGVKELAIIGNINSFADTLMGEFRKQAHDFGIKIVSDQSLSMGTRDFRTTLKKIESAKPDIVMSILEIPDFDIMRKQMFELGIDIPFTSVQQTEYSENSASFNDTWYIFYPDGSDKFLKNFKDFSKLRSTQNASIIYDIASIIVQAFENSDSVAGAIEWLNAQKTFVGETGEKYKQAGQFFQTEDIIKQVKDGKFEVVK
ncbi:MAG: ABC transporter substrate-binding protein [Alphaproteobacteria bacterium]|nr:ABC transporter substrate-binding protein [Alphaproteobacteria bacterium]